MHIVTAEIVSTALCFEDNFEIILVGFTYNCLNLLCTNVDKLNIKQEKMNTLRCFFPAEFETSSLWFRNKVILRLVIFFTFANALILFF